MGRIANAQRAALKASATAFIAEPLEYRIEHRGEERRVARLQGSTTGRDYGTVHPLLGRRLIVSANACQHLSNPERLPDLIHALNQFFDARPAERAKATDDLFAAAIACGALEE